MLSLGRRPTGTPLRRARCTIGQIGLCVCLFFYTRQMWSEPLVWYPISAYQVLFQPFIVQYWTKPCGNTV